MSGDLFINKNYGFSGSNSTIEFIFKLIFNFLPEDYYHKADKEGKYLWEYLHYLFKGGYTYIVGLNELTVSDFNKVTYALEEGIQHMEDREWAHEFYKKLFPNFILNSKEGLQVYKEDISNLNEILSEMKKDPRYQKNLVKK